MMVKFDSNMYLNYKSVRRKNYAMYAHVLKIATSSDGLSLFDHL